MIEYLLIAVAFATMMQIRYTFEVLGTIKEMCILLDITMKEVNFSPTFFSVGFFIFNIIFMPIILFYVFIAPRETVIKDMAKAILKSYFKLEEK